MYDYIIKTYDERTLYFFYNNGICVKDLSQKSNRYKVIYEEGIKDFAALDMGFGRVGIVCQNKEGSIIFLRESNDGYIKTVLLNNKSQVYYDKFFSLKLHGSWLGLSYIIEYNNNNILSFQIIDKENEPPLAVDYVSDKNYATFVDDDYNRIFFYNRENGFGYRIYKWSRKSFEEYEVLSQGKFISAINDFSGNYYIVFLKDNKYFLKILKEKEGILEACDLSLDFIELFDDVVLLVEGESLWIVVKRYNFTFGKKLDLKDLAFSSQYNFFCDGEITKVRVSVRDADKKIECCFGNIKELRPELILYKDLFNYKNCVKVTGIETLDGEPEKNEEIVKIEKLEIRVNELEKQVLKLMNADKYEK